MSILDGRILDTDSSEIPLSDEHQHTIDPSNSTMWPASSHQPVHPVMRHQLHGSIPSASHGPFESTEQTFFVGGNGSWPSMSGSENTPTPTYTPTPQDFDNNVFHQDRQTESVLSQRQFHSAQGFALPASIPMSPQSSQGWMSTASSEMADGSRAVKSPTLPPSSPRQRPDGIRKKNARFEIPKERNLGTIDGLIKYFSEQGDEIQLKELKQQKRLLRNRQAAYVFSH